MRGWRAVIIVATTAGAVGWSAHALGQGAGAQSARVAGVVYDSISHAALAGAVVQLVAAGTRGGDVRLTTSTDSAGRYAFAPVGRGRFLLGFFHPKLDSLGVEPPVTTLEIREERDHALALAVPSVATVLRQACGAGATRDSSGAVMGFVRNAATTGVMDGSMVRARWSEIVIGGKGGARVRVRESTTRTGDDGWYTLCHVPAGGLVLVNAGHASDSGATLEVSVPDDGLLVRDVYVSPAASTESPPVSATVRGTVRDPYGAPLTGARVRLWGDLHEVRSNERGEFVLGGLPSGTRMLELRALGYAPRRELVDLVPVEDVVVDLPLEEFPTTIDTVRVFGARPDARDPLAGFARRRALAHGVFLDPDQVERRRPLNFTDLLRGIAGVDIVTIGGARAVVMRALDGVGDCEPELVVDGLRVPRYDSSVDDLLPASIIQAIEVYPRRMQAPAEYQSLTCGSVVVWTGTRGWLGKRARGTPRSP
ncbi:MAG: carboxypeptidase regulatory-like domain-containing protein [Gemmatimonadota bacterium]